MAKRSQKKRKAPEAKFKQVTVEVPATIPAKGIPSRKPSRIPWSTIVQALVIASAVLWIYRPALHGDWLWDDDLLVTNNPTVHDPYGLWSIWFAPGSLFDYQPLKVSVVWLQWQLWGGDTLGYHLTNVVLHILGALLVWRLLGKLGLRLAWLGGLIFAVHPVQVESVAWIAELKNTLSLPPFLLAMCAYIDYEKNGKPRDYLLALGLFLAAMLCKPTMVMFPVVILLYGWWKNGRMGWRDVRSCVPFFAVSLVLGLVTLWFLKHHAIGNDPAPLGGFFSRLACGGLAIAFYFSKFFLPVGLLPIYPQWVIDPPTLAQFLPWPVLLAAIYWLWTKHQRWGRHALLGLGFFLINLAPFVGFNAGSYMAYTWVMDHVLYLPMIGLIGLIVAALEQVENLFSSSFRLYGFGLVTVTLLLLTFESRSYAKMYVDEQMLCSYELQHNPEAYTAYNNLGAALLKNGRVSEAMVQYRQALQIRPDYAAAHYNLGNALLKVGRAPEAIEEYEQALRIKPNNAQIHNNLGIALFQSDRLSEAIEQFKEALQISPDLANARSNLERLQAQQKTAPDAK